MKKKVKILKRMFLLVAIPLLALGLWVQSASAATEPAITSADNVLFVIGKNDGHYFTVTATGDSAPVLSQTGKPSWLYFNDNGNGTATMYAKPAADAYGTYNFTITATDGGATTTQSFTLKVALWQNYTGFSAGTTNEDMYFGGGLAVDTSGTLYATNFYKNAIYKMVEGEMQDISGGGRFNQPMDIAVDADGNLYVADTGNGRIKKLMKGQTQWTDITDDELFYEPYGIAVDSKGSVYVTDAILSKVVKLMKGQTQWTNITSDMASVADDGYNVPGPGGIEVDGSDAVYVKNRYAIMKLVNNTWSVVGRDFSAPSVAVAADASGAVYTGGGGGQFSINMLVNGQWKDISGGESFCFNYGLEADAEGNLYATDITNSHIKKLTVAPSPNLDVYWVYYDRNTAGSEHADVNVTVTPYKNTLTSITNGSYTLAVGTDYTVSGDTYTIKTSYLDSLNLSPESGSIRLKFNFGAATPQVFHLLFTDTTTVAVKDLFNKGTGTASDPFQIATAVQLSNVSKVAGTAGYYYVLTADVDLSGYTDYRAIVNQDESGIFRTVVKGWSSISNFSGYFNGNGHTISGLYIHNNDPMFNPNIGLFQTINTTATICNLTVEGLQEIGGVEVVSVRGASSNAGLLAGKNQGYIINCSTKGTISGDKCVGGLVGTNYTGMFNISLIEYCHADVDVIACSPLNLIGGTGTSGYGAGGLVGNNANGIIRQCYATGMVSGCSIIGGLIGINDGGKVFNCYASGNVTQAHSSSTGGLVGLTTDSFQYLNPSLNSINTIIAQCYSSGEVSCRFMSSRGFYKDIIVSGLVGRHYLTTSNPTPTLSKASAVTDSYCIETDIPWQAVNGTGYSVSDSIWGYLPDNSKDNTRTAEQLRKESTYTNPSDNSVAWDFEHTWAIDEGNGYPYLRPLPIVVLWQLADQEVTYKENGGTGKAPTGGKYAEDSQVTVATNTGRLIKAGYSFAGWHYGSVTGPIYQPGEVFAMPNGDVTLYAAWEAVSSTAALFDGGTGTKDDPYQIATAIQLYNINAVPRHTNYYKQTADIDLSDFAPGGAYERYVDYGHYIAGWKFIGDGDGGFYGHYDGGGKTISGLYIYSSSLRIKEISIYSNPYYAGLFGIIENDASVTGVTLKNVYIRSGAGNYMRGVSMGALASQNQGTVSDCHAVGTVTGMALGSFVGGLIGINDGIHSDAIITHCSADVKVNGASSSVIGGLVGHNTASILNSSATGAVTAYNPSFTDSRRPLQSYQGGLVGKNEDISRVNKEACKIVNSYATGDVSGRDYNGGLIGANRSAGIITNAYATGNVSSKNGICGGLVGANLRADPSISRATITNAYATGSVSGTTCGGLVGSNIYGTFTSSFWDKDTTGQTPWLGDGNAAESTVYGMSAAELWKSATFTGWNVGAASSVWGISEDVGYPYLKAALESIAITAPATKLTYIVDDSLDISDMVVTGTYSDSSTKTETVTAVDITGFDSKTPIENQVLTVTVDGKSTTYTVTINVAPAITLQSIGITTPATKLTYTVGDSLDINGMVVTGTYSDSSTKTETVTESNITGFDSSAPTTNQVLTVTVGGKSTTYTVIINVAPAATLQSIAITTPATKLTYTVGDSLDINGMVVTGTYSDSSTKTETVAESNITGFDSNAPTTNQVLTVTVGGKSTTYTVIINAVPVATLQSIAITTHATKLTYTVGDSLDFNGMVVTGTYSDSSTKSETVIISDITGFDSSASTTNQTLTVTVSGKSTTYTVTINAVPVADMDASISPASATDDLNAPAEPTAHSITLQSGGNGTVSSNVYSATKGTQVTLITAPDTGYRFKEWQVLNGGVTITDNEFTMTDNNVTVKANFEQIPATAYQVAVNGSYAAASGAGSYSSGDIVTVNAGSRSNYTFNGWTSSDGITFANANSATTTFTMPTGNVTVTAFWSYNGSSGDSSGGGGSNPGSTDSSTDSSTEDDSDTTEVQQEAKLDQPTIGSASVKAKQGVDNSATANISEKTVANAIAKAQAEAAEQERSENGIGVSLSVSSPAGTEFLEIVLTQPVLSQLPKAEVSSFEIDSGLGSLNFDLEAVKEIQKQSTGNVTISFIPATNLNDEVKTLVGTRPVYNISISYVKDGKTANITTLGSGSVTLSLPYTLGKNEAVGYLFGVYVDGKGNATRIKGSTYDANSKSIIFNSDHFSIYGVGYTAPSEKFKDISSYWAKESIDYVVGRGLFSGTSVTTFSPDAAMSRGMLVTVLGRLAGVDVSDYKTVSFTDVAADKYYTPYIEWAYKNGIVSGIGNSQFAPDRAITREEIALILSNYAKATGYTLPVTREAAAFADAVRIGSTYKDAVTTIQQASIMMGGNGNKFNPRVSATRAEVSAILHRYIKLTIDPSTAQGWAVNDAGQRLYYKDGKALIGWQTIASKKYFFDTDGAMQKGWKKDEKSNWYYLSINGALVGWQNIGSGDSKKRYYFTKDAVMVSAKWLDIDKKWYYFNTDGSLAVSTKVDGYEVDKNGVRQFKTVRKQL